jgi:hypothetical protein
MRCAGSITITIVSIRARLGTFSISIRAYSIVTRIIAYQISGPDNGLSWFADAPPDIFCRGCGRVQDDLYVPLRIGRSKILKKYPLSYTYDGRALVRTDFLDFLRTLNPPRTLIARGDWDVGVFELSSALEVPFDFEKRKTFFGANCQQCGKPFEVVGASPGFLRGIESLPNYLFRTDLEFGRGAALHPLLIVGSQVKSLVRQAGFKGVDYGVGTNPDSLRAAR